MLRRVIRAFGGPILGALVTTLALASASTARAQVAAAAPVVPVAPSAPTANAPSVRVRLVTDDKDVVLERRDDEVEAWSPACSAPCDARVLARPYYRVSGAGVVASAPFSFISTESPAWVYVKPGSAVARGLAGATIIGGGLTALTGFVYGNGALAGAFSATDKDDRVSKFGTGWAVVGVGALLVVVGIAWYAGTDTYVFHEGQRIAASKSSATVR